MAEEDELLHLYSPAYELLEKLRKEEQVERLRQRGPWPPQIFVGVRFRNNTYGIMEPQYWDPEKATFIKFLVGYVAAVDWATERIKPIKPQFDDKQIDNLLKLIEKRQEEQYTIDSVLPDA